LGREPTIDENLAVISTGMWIKRHKIYVVESVYMYTGSTYSQAFTFAIAVAHCLIQHLCHTPSIIMQQASGKK
jgi:hypothetical protein